MGLVVERRLIRSILSLTLLLSVSSLAIPVWAWLDNIRHPSKPAEIPTDTNPTLRALIECDNEQTCIRRVCFRLNKHPEADKLAAAIDAGHYCVPLRNASLPDECGLIEPKEFIGILPMPEEGSEITYYFETTEDDFDRKEYTVAAIPLGGPATEPAEITVYLTKPNAPERPPGFKPDGILSYVPVGSTSPIAIGGGLSTGLVTGVAAAVAGGVGVGVVASGSNTSTVPPTTTTVPPPPVTTTITPPPMDVRPEACFTTRPSILKIEVGTTVRFDASCSRGNRDPMPGQQPVAISEYAWDFGDGRRGNSGKDVPHVYLAPGIFPATLTVTNEVGKSDSFVRNVEVGQASADLGVKLIATPTRVDIEIRNDGPEVANNVRLEYTLTGPLFTPTLNPPPAGVTCTESVVGLTYVVSCQSASLEPNAMRNLGIDLVTAMGTYTHTATISSDTPDRNESDNGFVVMATTLSTFENGADRGESLRPPNGSNRDRAALETSFVSHLIAPSSDGEGVRARVSSNQRQTDPVDGRSPFWHRIDGERGRNVVEGHLTTPLERGARWRFDFSSSPHFAKGSLRVEMGEVVTSDATSVTIRLRGNAGERVRFTFDLPN